MDLPKEKIGFLKSHRGDVTPEGWLVLAVANLALASRPLAALAQEPRASSASDPAGAIGRDPAALARPPRGARAPETAPAAVLLSNGQRWERVTLRHVDVRTLAPLVGATVLPT